MHALHPNCAEINVWRLVCMYTYYGKNVNNVDPTTHVNMDQIIIPLLRLHCACQLSFLMALFSLRSRHRLRSHLIDFCTHPAGRET